MKFLAFGNCHSSTAKHSGNQSGLSKEGFSLREKVGEAREQLSAELGSGAGRVDRCGARMCTLTSRVDLSTVPFVETSLQERLRKFDQKSMHRKSNWNRLN